MRVTQSAVSESVRLGPRTRPSWSALLWYCPSHSLLPHVDPCRTAAGPGRIRRRLRITASAWRCRSRPPHSACTAVSAGPAAQGARDGPRASGLQERLDGQQHALALLNGSPPAARRPPPAQSRPPPAARPVPPAFADAVPMGSGRRLLRSTARQQSTHPLDESSREWVSGDRSRLDTTGGPLTVGNAGDQVGHVRARGPAKRNGLGFIHQRHFFCISGITSPKRGPECSHPCQWHGNRPSTRRIHSAEGGGGESG
jgi:hypothetical protein